MHYDSLGMKCLSISFRSFRVREANVNDFHIAPDKAKLRGEPVRIAMPIKTPVEEVGRCFENQIKIDRKISNKTSKYICCEIFFRA